jgi:HEPN domain-containing protein
MTQEWIDKAEGDTKVAVALWQMADPVYDAICFHAQQCVDDLRFLTSFAVEIRYPGIFASRQDAERCWQSAARARALLREHLGLESASEP